VLRVLVRVPSEQARREAIAARLGGRWPWSKATLAVDDTLSKREHAFLEALEDSAFQRCAARVDYLSPQRGTIEARHISVLRIAYHERPLRVLAVCHRSKQLKWFRLDRVQGLALDEAEAFVAADIGAIEDVVGNTLLGFHQEGDPIACSFVVAAPEHRWFVPTLGPRAAAEPCGSAVRVTIITAALQVLARELVGLGAAVHVETPELRDAVRRLAQAALRGSEDI
jgi:predicted DNA-binding transcriptional regulator YafY